MKRTFLLASIWIGLSAFAPLFLLNAQSPTAKVADRSGPQIMVIGGVSSPGIFPLGRISTVSEAIAAAGGTVKSARLKRIRVLRAVGNSLERQEIVVDLKAIANKRAEDIVLLENDIVDVPFRQKVRPEKYGCILRGTLTSVPYLIR